MKTLLFILFPLLALAQIPYPDTLVMKDGKSYPCLITDISDSKIGIIYSQNVNESVLIQAIKQISLEGNGIVFISETGFTKQVNIINAYIKTRKNKLDAERIVKEEADRLEVLSNSDNAGLVALQFQRNNTQELNAGKNQWSFGVLLIPYYSGRIYNIFSSPQYYPNYYPPEIFDTAIQEINMEAQLAYSLAGTLHFTLDVSYTSTFSERRSEYNRRPNDPLYSNYDSGSFIKDELTLIDFILGIKYYFTNKGSGKVSIYGLAGIGKQFASGDSKYENLYPGPTPVIRFEENQKEFIEDSNSPFHFNLGFGAEYFFNESLSLTSNIRFLYSSVKAKYNSRTITEMETYTNSIDFKKSDFITRVGLGLNFYF